MLKIFIEKTLESEIENHLSKDNLSENNKRIGKGKKTIKSGLATF
jgi:hypothetical protein|tara:strand:- start:332 stop:466 length:135 start_codon:yes stop_codon:yes gene_type:complete